MHFSEAEIQCPFCLEIMAVPTNIQDGLKQDFIEDCAVCCRPIRIVVEFDGDGESQVTVHRS